MDILHRLVKECDVLVENYLPGSLAKYAMDYDTVSKINPGIVSDSAYDIHSRHVPTVLVYL